MATWGGRWRTTGTTRGGVEQLGLTHTETPARHVVGDLNAEGSGQQKPWNDPHSNQHTPSAPTAGLCERGNDPTQAAAAVRTQRPNAACEGKNG